MRRTVVRTILAGACLVTPLAGCGSDQEGGETHQFLRARFEAEMKAILHDLQAAEEQAAAIEGRYLTLDQLRGTYLNRPVPESYTLTVTDVSTSGYRAEIVHGPTSLRCSLEVGGATQARSGSPRCD